MHSNRNNFWYDANCDVSIRSFSMPSYFNVAQIDKSNNRVRKGADVFYFDDNKIDILLYTH